MLPHGSRYEYSDFRHGNRPGKDGSHQRYVVHAVSNWMVKGESWQAFLGGDDHVFVFKSPAEVLAYLEDGGRNELSDHPKWAQFSRKLETMVLPTKSRPSI